MCDLRLFFHILITHSNIKEILLIKAIQQIFGNSTIWWPVGAHLFTTYRYIQSIIHRLFHNYLLYPQSVDHCTYSGLILLINLQSNPQTASASTIWSSLQCLWTSIHTTNLKLISQSWDISNFCDSCFYGM